ncbi:HNH endonuclease [Kribbella karoonensis]|uniref:HNH nuclease domain-containing protein n=1 Tax=Kribbella karoonensis TaxID=324851 RepID=A0ABP4PHM8_9ACTN
MDILGGRPVVAIGNHEVLPALDQVDADINRLLGIRLQLIARAEADGLAQEVGARDTVELLTLRHRRDRAEVWRDVRLARALPKYKAVDTALTHGIESADGTVLPLQTAQAAAIITELERVRSRVATEVLDVTEHQLVGLAATHSPKELRAAAKQLCDRIDFDGPEPEEQKAYARESLTLRPGENGVKFTGFLANENAELLQAIVHTGARPHKTADGDHDPRPRDKRQADALTTALTVAANAWDTDTAGHGAKANITVTIDLDDLRSATAHATGQTIYGDDLSAATIRRMACDANVIPLVLGSNSEPLDVGRRERLVTRHIRHALIARDHGCVVCAAPPVMCDAHHLTSWLDGGPTSVENLALLCRRHHVDLHNNRWTITITNGQVQVARPAWATPTTTQPTSATPTTGQPTWATPTTGQPTAATPTTTCPARSTTHPTSANSSAAFSAQPCPNPAQHPARPEPPPTEPPPAAPRPAAPRPAAPRPAAPRPAAPRPAAPRPAAPRPAAPPPAERSPADVPHTPAQPVGASARPDHPDNRPTPPQPTKPPGDPWGDTPAPAPRTSRWKADEATLTAAARFAVWGTRTPTKPSTGPPPFATL